jgi:hypothetical protein
MLVKLLTYHMDYATYHMDYAGSRVVSGFRCQHNLIRNIAFLLLNCFIWYLYLNVRFLNK